MSAQKDMEIDDDSIAAYEKKILQFRLIELKDVLTQVGLSKQGKKQDLTDRILALLYDEGTPGLFKNNVNGKQGLLAIIDETHRKMQGASTGNSNTKKHSTSGSRRPKEEVDESDHLEKKIRCPCGSESAIAQMVQCLDSDCNVWQHSKCVIIPEKPMENIPTQFLCEVCRLKRTDPFWATMAHPLQSFKLLPASIPVDGTNPHVSVEKTFKLTRVDKDLLQMSDYDVQVWCMLLNDTVPFRIQWPQYADLQVNGIPVKTVSRPGSQQLGANGRDDGPKITASTLEGLNKISFSFSDARSFCFGVRLVRRRTLEQVFGMIPKEPDGESFEDALARVQRCIGGGITAGNDDSDSDLEVIADSVSVSLRCPMSGSRMKTAGRFRACVHMGCFDLETFVGINERTRKWQCPICLKNCSLEDLIVDPFFNRILNMMRSCGEEINEIDMKPDGHWRVKKAREAGDLAKWHNPDGSVEFLSGSRIGQERVLDMENNAFVQSVDVPQHTGQSLINQGIDEVENHELNIITMSSTTTENGKDVGDPSINQDGDEQEGVFNGTEPEISSGMNRGGRTYEMNDQNIVLPTTDIIILSDSEDDDVLVYPESVSVAPPVIDGHSASAPADNLNFFSAGPPTEGVGLFDGNNVDTLVSHSSFPPYSLEGSICEQFGTSDSLIDEHNSATCSEHVNDILTLETAVDPVSHVMDLCDQLKSSSDYHLPAANGNISVEALSCPSASGNELQQVNFSVNDHLNMSIAGGNGRECSSSNAEALQESAAAVEDSLVQRTQGDSGSGSGSGSGLGSGFDPTDNRKRPDGPFSFPRQQRSTRQRIHRSGS